MPQSQPVNSSQVDGLSSQFQRRWESVYHWRSMCSMLLGTPGLRAAWPMSIIEPNVASRVTDMSGHGNHLTDGGAAANVTFGYDPTPGIAPIAVFSGAANSYLIKGDAGGWADILGTEAYIIAAQRGLTIGGWFWWSALPGARQFLMVKDDVGANRQYGLRITAANAIDFIVWLGAVAVVSAATIKVGWNHCVGIYDQPSQDLHVVLNGVVTTNAGAGPVALANTAAPFTIGTDGIGGNRFTGYASDCFLSAVSLRHGFVKAGFHYTKAAFGAK